jgi:hypothetical protein
MDIIHWIWIIGSKTAGQKAIVLGRIDGPWGRGQLLINQGKGKPERGI